MTASFPPPEFPPPSATPSATPAAPAAPGGLSIRTNQGESFMTRQMLRTSQLLVAAAVAAVQRRAAVVQAVRVGLAPGGLVGALW